MATYTISESTPPYYRVTVEFGGQAFEQQIVSSKTGGALGDQLQAYADAYEAEWYAPVNPNPEA